MFVNKFSSLVNILFRKINHPVFLSKAGEISEYSNSLSSLGQLLYSIFVLILLIACIFWVSKFLKNKNFGFIKNQNLEIIEKFALGVGNSLAIIRCGENYVLIAITKDKITFLKDINKEELIFMDKEELASKENMNFSTIFNNYLKTKVKKDGSNDEKNE